MDVKELIQKEQEFAKYEYQLKIKADIEENALHKLGARKVGIVLHEDRYFIAKGKKVSETDELVRLRKEGGEDLLFTYKGPLASRKVRTRTVINKAIEEKEALDIKKNYDEIVSVNKKRSIFLLDSVVINIDKVENVGNFIEFEVINEDESLKIDFLMRKLGLDPLNATRFSYFELAIMTLTPLQRIFAKIHDKFGRFSFGISSAVLTTLGVIVGLNSATASLLAVIGGIIAVAISDSLSDSIGMYTAKKAERGISPAIAFKSALNVFLGKFIFTLSFLVPFGVFSISWAIYAGIFWGLILLTFVNLQIAFLHEENVAKSVVKNIFIAIAVIIVSYFAGRGVALFG